VWVSVRVSMRVSVWVKLSFQCLRPSASLRAAGNKNVPWPCKSFHHEKARPRLPLSYPGTTKTVYIQTKNINVVKALNNVPCVAPL
jgi:hypothetical protein